VLSDLVAQLPRQVLLPSDWITATADVVSAAEPIVRLSHVLEHGYDGGEAVSISRGDLIRLAQAVGVAKLLLKEIPSV